MIVDYSYLGIMSGYAVTQEEARRGLLSLYDSISSRWPGIGLDQAEMFIASMPYRPRKPDWNGLE